MTYRTLSDAVAIRDSSNRTLKFPRTAREAGIRGALTDVSPPEPLWKTPLVVLAVGMVVAAALFGMVVA